MNSRVLLFAAFLLLFAVSFVVASPSTMLRQLNRKLTVDSVSTVTNAVTARHASPDLLKHLFMASASSPLQDPRGPGVEATFFEDSSCRSNITEPNFIPGPLSPQCVNAFGPIYAIENCDRDGKNFLYVLSQDPTCKAEEISIRAPNAAPGKCGPATITQAGYSVQVYGIITCYFQ